jgi:2-polyprenyl-3-methyl-5-hydroxy-6-metoxy-1,4-benzoquinol methylase
MVGDTVLDEHSKGNKMNPVKKENFRNKFTDILNYSALNLAMAIGYKKHLFDVMKDAGKPLPCSMIANNAAVDKRYVQEWLGIMCTGKIIDLVKDENKQNLYSLPEEHAAFLTWDGDAGMGVYTQEIPLLTVSAMESVDKDFSQGKGISFSVYPKFQEFMAELSQDKLKNTFIEKFLPGVANGELIPRLEKGIRVCDLGCGQGVAVNLMAAAWPNSSFVGIDNHEQAVEAARAASLEQQFENAKFLIEDASGIKEKPEFFQRFDYIFAFDAIHDQTHPFESLCGIRHMLAPGGLFSMIEIDASSDHAGNMDNPMGPFLYTVSMMHCMPVGLCDNGAGLGMMWGRNQAVKMLAKAGFNDVAALEMDHDPFNVHYLCKV